MATNGEGKRPRRRYTAEEREAIVADAESRGQSEAARRHGVPQSTLSHWQRAAALAALATGVATKAPSDAEPNTVAADAGSEAAQL